MFATGNGAMDAVEKVTEVFVRAYRRSEVQGFFLADMLKQISRSPQKGIRIDIRNDEPLAADIKELVDRGILVVEKPYCRYRFGHPAELFTELTFMQLKEEEKTYVPNTAAP